METLTYPEWFILAGTAGMAFCGAALAWHQGRRRAVVGIPVTLILGAMVAPAGWLMKEWDGALAGIVVLVSVLLLLLSILAVPLLSLAGLFEREYPWRVRLGQALLVLLGWMLGPVMMALRALSEFH